LVPIAEARWGCRFGNHETHPDEPDRDPGEETMPMIDVYATGGTFANPHALARDLASTLMKIEQVPDLPNGALSNVEGDGNYVRVQVLTNAGALNREKQLAVVRQFTDLIAAAAGDPSISDRTWVLLTEAVEGGWGLAGHANTNEELIAAARAQIAELQRAKAAGG
jgi:phenylpyruvate tautomerase PptA (4-oxalocrotonate tautomerase family)